MHQHEEAKQPFSSGTSQRRYAQTKSKHQPTPRDSQSFLEDVEDEGLALGEDKENLNLGNLNSEPVTPLDTHMLDESEGSHTPQYPKGKAAKRKNQKAPLTSVYEEPE